MASSIAKLGVLSMDNNFMEDKEYSEEFGFEAALGLKVEAVVSTIMEEGCGGFWRVGVGWRKEEPFSLSLSLPPFVLIYFI